MALFNNIKVILPYFISLLCIVSLVYMLDFSKVIIIINEINSLWLILAIVLLLPNIFIRILRWSKIINVSDLKYNIIFLSKVYLIGQTLNLFLPGSLGDIGKFYFGIKKEKDKLLMLGSSFIDKLYGIGSLLILGIIVTAFIGELSLLFAELLMLLGLILIIVKPIMAIKIFKTFKVKKTFISTFLKYLQFFKKTKSIFKLAMIYSILGWFVTIIIYIILFEAFKIDISYYTIIVLVPVLYILRMLPVSIAGIGTTDMFTLYYLGNGSFTDENLLSLSIMANIILVIIPGIVGLFFLIGYKGQKNEE